MAALGLSCSIQDLLVPWPGIVPGSLHWECRVLATRLPGKSQGRCYFWIWNDWYMTMSGFECRSLWFHNWAATMPLKAMPFLICRLVKFSWTYLMVRNYTQHLVQDRRVICCCLASKSCLTLDNLMDCSPPGSSADEISQAIILE